MSAFVSHTQMSDIYPLSNLILALHWCKTIALLWLLLKTMNSEQWTVVSGAVLSYSQCSCQERVLNVFQVRETVRSCQLKRFLRLVR